MAINKETHLCRELARLKTNLLVMCATVENVFLQGCEAFVNHDFVAAEAVIDGDMQIDALEDSIDRKTLTILVRNQPVAQDLRFAIGTLRMVIDLERIGDEIAGICERVLMLQSSPPVELVDAVLPLMRNAGRLYRDAVEAFSKEDSSKALKISKTNEESDRLEEEALQAIMTAFPNDQDSLITMHGILICHALNRICRHAANLAEHTYFIILGVSIKHKHADAL